MQEEAEIDHKDRRNKDLSDQHQSLSPWQEGAGRDLRRLQARKSTLFGRQQVLKDKEKRGMTASSLPPVQLSRCLLEAGCSREVEDKRSVSLSYEPISLLDRCHQVLPFWRLQASVESRSSLWSL
jgi:hypothetical protein